MSKTIIVCGATNTGTSLIAGTLQILGVPMGASKTDYCFEDLRFAKPFFDKSMLVAVQDNNNNYKVWGWKFPFMRNWFEQVYPALQNPMFIYCIRDSIERAKQKPEKYNNPTMFNELAEESAFWESFFFFNKLKPLVIEFGMDKGVLFNKLCSFLSIEPTKEQLELYSQFNNPNKGYSLLTR